MSRSVDQQRAQLGRDAIYPLRVAAGLVPGRTEDNLLAFEQAGIVHNWRGQRVVVWGDVLRLIRGDDVALETSALPTPPGGGQLRRAQGLPRRVAL